MKKLTIIFILLLLFIIGVYLIRNSNSKNFNLVYVEDAIDSDIEKDLINLLNKKINKNDANKQIDYYVGGFSSEYLNKPINDNHFNILRLGSFNRINLDTLRDYDLVLSSSVDLATYLKSYNINTFFIPLYSNYKNKKYSKCAVDGGDDCFWLMIGEMGDVEEYILLNNIKYKKYKTLSLNNVKYLSDNFDKISGVIVASARLSALSYDINPIFLEFIIRKIPIFTEALKVEKHSEYSDTFIHLLFSDAVSYYTYPKDISYFFNNIEYRKQKANYAFNFFVNFFSIDAIVNKIFNILDIKDISLNKQNTVSIFSPTFTGLYNNGDYWIAKDIESKFNEFNYKTLVYFPTSQLSNIGDIDIYIRGGMPLTKRTLDKNKSSIAYILFPFFENEENFNLENFDIDKYINNIQDELLRYDAVAVASKNMLHSLKKHNINAYYIPQFTNIKKFYPDYDEQLKSEILFVGNKTFYRKAPMIVYENQLPITIYGDNWGDIAKSKYIDNQILRKYYSSAKIVLNDTRQVMKNFGFIINRIFDVTACKGFIISDYMKEIEEIYGDSVPMYKTNEELIYLLKYYLDPNNEQERLEKINRAHEITIKNFTSDITVKKFIDIDKDIRKNKQLLNN